MFLCLLALQVLSIKTLQVAAMSLQDTSVHVCSCIDASQVESLKCRHGWDPGGDCRPILLPPNCFSTWNVQTDSDLSKILNFLIKLFIANSLCHIKVEEFRHNCSQLDIASMGGVEAVSFTTWVTKEDGKSRVQVLLNHTCRCPPSNLNWWFQVGRN